MTEKTKATAKQGKPAKPAKEPKKVIDWDRIRAMYRANILSVREIAAANGISHVYIGKKRTEENGVGWERDLSKAISSKADAIVSRATVTSAVTKEAAAKKVVTDRVIVEANAEVIANVRLNHRREIARFRALVITMLQELEHQTEHNALYHDLADALEAKDQDGNPTGTDKLNDIYRRVIGMPQRVDSLKKLSETLKVLIALEREAYNIAAIIDDPAAKAREGVPLSAQDAYMAMIGK